MAVLRCAVPSNKEPLSSDIAEATLPTGAVLSIRLVIMDGGVNRFVLQLGCKIVVFDPRYCFFGSISVDCFVTA